MTLIDAIGAYELTADLYYEPRVRRAAFEAGTAVVLLNDLYSVTKDLGEAKPPCNMVLQVAADRECSIDDATEIVVALHNEFVRQFEANHRALQEVPSVELQRFMRGLRAWMGCGFEWHEQPPLQAPHAAGLSGLRRGRAGRAAASRSHSPNFTSMVSAVRRSRFDDSRRSRFLHRLAGGTLNGIVVRYTMGTYVEFIACPPEGPIAQIVAPIVDFADWYPEFFEEEIDPEVLALIAAVSDHGGAALAHPAPELGAVVDRLVTIFYGQYCDCTRGPRLRDVSTSVLRVHRYRLLHEEMSDVLDPTVSELWRYIYLGRTVASSDPTRAYTSSDDASWVAWWSLAEIQVLRSGLPPRGSVGTVETGGVIDAVHDALDFAEQAQCGLVITAF